eukprot:CAMPEP_0184697310 /NCGR_PEP_ID=MMETSP0313-20130426/4314_1 /TAXON_ID=2792 /ORGANISM="Porphyridium aerugineum, Strain SAG 1380-2" /LENGTH=1095 /DNA_ID=CAMNT_0027156087 /DNA_START=364 /DNA_END=3648 /DNA_ORIENTATION=+
MEPTATSTAAAAAAAMDVDAAAEEDHPVQDSETGSLRGLLMLQAVVSAELQSQKKSSGSVGEPQHHYLYANHHHSQGVKDEPLPADHMPRDDSGPPSITGAPVAIKTEQGFLVPVGSSSATLSPIESSTNPAVKKEWTQSENEKNNVKQNKRPLNESDESRDPKDSPREKPSNRGSKSAKTSEKRYCLCKMPWSGDQFMVGCEGGCKNWFHKDCINLSESDVEKLTKNRQTKLLCNTCSGIGEFIVGTKGSKSSPPSKSGNTTGSGDETTTAASAGSKKTKTRLYCVCQKPWRNDRFMVGCENESCGQWFHKECINLENANFTTKSVFYCNSCDPSGDYRVYSDKKEFDEVWTKLRQQGMQQSAKVEENAKHAESSPGGKASRSPISSPGSARMKKRSSAANLAKAVVSDGCRKSATDEEKTLYCICRSEYDPKKFMIGCEQHGCTRWFHPACIFKSRIEEKKARHPRAVFFCDWCDPTGEFNLVIPSSKSTGVKSDSESQDRDTKAPERSGHELTENTTDDKTVPDSMGVDTSKNGATSLDLPRERDKPAGERQSAKEKQDTIGQVQSDNSSGNPADTKLDPSRGERPVSSSPHSSTSKIKVSTTMDNTREEKDHGGESNSVRSTGADSQTLICVCQKQKSYNPGSFSIRCAREGCNREFHPECINVSKEDAAHPKAQFFCDSCSSSKEFEIVLPRVRRNMRIDYNSLNDGHYTAKNSLPQKGTVAFRKFLREYAFDPHPFAKISGSMLNRKYAEKTGLKDPVLIEKPDGLGMKLPDGPMTVEVIGDAVGRFRSLDVLDVVSQTEVTPQWTLARWVDYFTNDEEKKERILNVISLEISHTPLADMVSAPKMVFDIGWVETSWPKSPMLNNLNFCRDHPFTKLQYPKVQLYSLMSVADVYTDFHIDFGGSSVWYHLFSGAKEFYLIRPTEENLKIYQEWANSPTQNLSFLADRVDECFKVTLEVGNTMIIPSGWIHAVYTPKDSIVFGGNFLHSFNLDMQLRVHDIEKQSFVARKYHFPYYYELHVYALMAYRNHIINQNTEYIKLLGPNEKKAIRKLAVELEAGLRHGWLKVSQALKDSVDSCVHDLTPIIMEW